MASPLGLHAGDIIGGDFVVIRALGAGGMGAVYLCRQKSTRRKRAVKVMHPLRAADPRHRRRFEQEARVGARIDSAHVVEVIGAGVDERLELPWLAMEWLEGDNLAELVGRLGALDEAATHDVLRQVCDALGAAHDGGVVHRDLKPENVFVVHAAGEQGRPFVKLLDFGIAKVIAEAHGSLTGGVGTPKWMAPEQTELDYNATAASDVWSLGLLAYYLLTGDTFWRADSIAQLMNEIMLEPIPMASDRAAATTKDLPAEFDAWFARCVTRDLDERFVDGRAAWAQLAALLTPPPEGQLVLRAGRGASAVRTVAGVTSSQTAAKPAAHDSQAGAPPAQTRARLWWVAPVAMITIGGTWLAGRNVEPPAPLAAAPPMGAPLSTAFEAAYRMWKQGRFEASRRALSALLANEPTHARAALYLGLDGRPSQATRKLLSTAVSHRTTLSASDAALLEASSPALSPVPDLAAWETELNKAVERHPEHTFMRVTLARVRGLRGDVPGARDSLVTAEKLDADIAPASFAIRGRLEREVYDNAASLNASERCLAAAPNATECLAGKARILALAGKCEALERTARHWIAEDAQDPRAHHALALALAANQANEQAIKIALEAKWEQQENREELPSFNYVATEPWLDRYQLHALFGRFDKAIDLAKVAVERVPATAGMMAHYQPNWLLAMAASEAKAKELAGETAMAFVERARAWTPDDPRQTAAPLLFLSVARDRGRMQEAEFQKRRSRWLQLANAATARAGSSVDAYTRAFPWIIGYAVPAQNKERAMEALAAMSKYEPIPPPTTRLGDVQLVIGRVFAYGGEPEKALPYFEGAVHSCLILENPFAALYGYVSYARVLVELGRSDEAPRWLERVLSYWGKARPASRYADKARAALAALPGLPD